MSVNRKASSLVYPYAAIAITITAAILVFLSSRRQSLTIDEPNHIYCGTEYLQYGTYYAWPENPPLSRMLTALGPYLNGHRINKVDSGIKSMSDYFNASYDLTYFDKGPVANQLFWSRIFILPLFLLSAWIVWRWSKRLAGEKGAFLATGMYVTLPTMMAHSGLGTTDVSFTVIFFLTVWRFARWLPHPTIPNACWLALAMTAAMLTKYSIISFFPAVACTLVLLFVVLGVKHLEYSWKIWFKRFFATGLFAAVITCLLIWGAFGFSYGKLEEQPVIRAGINERQISPRLGALSLPAPEWFAGVEVVLLHNRRGHRAYLDEAISIHGFRNFYPIIILLKTPWPFLLMLLAGLAGALQARRSKDAWEVIGLVLLPFAILVAAMPSNINLGVRHVLPFYPLAAVAGAVGTVYLLTGLKTSAKRQLLNWAVPLLVTLQLLIAVFAFPDFLAYFNPLGGKEPGRRHAGSDLDWGQGLFELSRFCKTNKIDTLNISYYGLVKDCWFDLPVLRFMSDTARPRGWIAVSENLYRGVWIPKVTPMDRCNKMSFELKPLHMTRLHHSYRWLDKYPLAAKIAGGAIRVYHVP